jgi:hypothetical protein
LVGKWIWLEINVLAEDGFQAIEPFNLRFCMRLPELGNLVDQMFGSWNRLASWLRGIDGVRAADLYAISRVLTSSTA